ncbi:hypothetical protein B0H19DRAFT_146943 [Mycena capillaripes]|nr:hypothetical protein B0H19DRAFT_146943 [Mycena capillaripes]
MPKAKPSTQPNTKAAAPAKKPRPSRSKKPTLDEADSDSDSNDLEPEKPAKRPARQLINWVKNPEWTDSLVTYLTDNPDFRRKLFSDSTAVAKKEKRDKAVGKDGKAVQYGVLAKHIFEDDPKEKARYANADPSKYASSVETRIWRLKKEYKVHLGVLGATGAGLEPADVTPGSKFASLIDKITAGWPWWPVLHSFWRELPSYNPVGIQSSEPGTDHASAAADLFESTAASSEAETDTHLREDNDEEDGRSATSMARDLEGDGGDDKPYSVSSGSEDESVVEVSNSSRSSTPPVPAPVVKKVVRGEPKEKTKVVSGRDLGLAKAKATKSSGAAKTKPKNAVERLHDMREAEAMQLDKKRRRQHDVDMERIKIKRMKYELKLAQAENERLRLNRHATSQSPRRRNRVLHLGSPSPSKSRSSRYSTVSPRHVEFNHVPSLPTFDGVTHGSEGGGSSSYSFDINGMPDFSTMDYSLPSTSSADDYWQ